MSECPPTPVTPEELESPGIIVPPPPGRTRLITTAGDGRPTYTANRECDAVTAVKRGLREYLEQVFIDVAGERVYFQRVMEAWAESDDVARYPACAIMARDEADYDASSLTPSLDTTAVSPMYSSPAERRTFLVKYAEVTVPLVIEVHTSSPEERVHTSMLLEDALNPVDWMYGFKLQLPHYFNQIAVFEPVKTQQLDSEDNARRRWRPGTVFLSASISLVRSRSLPGLLPQVSIEVTDPSGT